MNTLRKIVYLILISLAIVSCTRDYDAPPLSEPQYDGKANITIANLKKQFPSSDRDNPTLIDVDYIVRGYVTSNDAEGNVFKQLYIDDGTAGINIGVDQNSLYSIYRPGQEIFIELHGLYIVNYGGELQIGNKGSQANRINWETFSRVTHLNKWPDKSKIEPIEVTLDEINASDVDPEKYVNRLVRFNNIAFANGGKGLFYSGSENYKSEIIKDAKGNTIDLRTSSYATFAKDTLPKGKGSITALLGRYNGSWQLTLRSLEDVFEKNDEILAPDKPDPSGETVFSETFGKAGGNIKIADYKEFDAKSPVSYSDASSNADIRAIGVYKDGAFAWLPANKEAYLTIKGINTAGKNNLVLTYTLAANFFDRENPDKEITGNLNVVTVKCDGKVLPVPDKVIARSKGDDNKQYTVTLKDIPAKENIEIEFFSSEGTGNTFGMRLDNIKIQTGDGTVVIEPSK